MGIRHDNLFAHQWYLGTDDDARCEQSMQKNWMHF